MLGLRTAEVTGKDSGMVLGEPAREGESPVHERVNDERVSGVPRDTRNRRGKTGGPPSKPKYYLLTDSGAVP